MSVPEWLRSQVERRVLLALSRFGPRLHKVSVSLAEPRNPLGGTDRQCRLRVWLEAGEPMRSEAMDGAFEDAAGRAAAQIAKRLDLDLSTGPRRQSRRPPR